MISISDSLSFFLCFPGIKNHKTYNLNSTMDNFEQLKTVKFYSGDVTPLEMHKVRVVQKLNLLPIEERKESI